jgi:hypothetical protein
VIIVLSNNSVKSTWVEREWKAKYWEELENNKSVLLPVLIEDCKIPTLLKTKKYADFRSDYSVALVELMGSISPTISRKPKVLFTEDKSMTSKITELITKVQSRTIPLSQCIAEALSLAKENNNSPLESFCSGELTGWDKDKEEKRDIKYRTAQVYVSATHQINMQYMGWEGSASNALEYLKTDTKNFTPTNLFMHQPVSMLEVKTPSDPSKSLLSIAMKVKNFTPNSKYPDEPVYVYASSHIYQNILEAIREELTRRLIELLPKLNIA